MGDYFSPFRRVRPPPISLNSSNIRRINFYWRRIHIEGRLLESTLALLRGADIQFHRHSRLDIALCINHPIALIFLPAGDIPRFVGEGRVDLGITGQDQVAESSEVTSFVEELLELGFGKCKLQIQVPEKGDIHEPKDLIGKNIVSSFTNLTWNYFNSLESQTESRHETNGTKKDGTTEPKTRIKYVGGSVEAACALGIADGIVDLVGMCYNVVFFKSKVSLEGEYWYSWRIESGETMKAAGLKPIGTVMDTQAVLIKSKTPTNPSLVDIIVSRIRGVISAFEYSIFSNIPLTTILAAQKYVLCTYNVPRSKLSIISQITPGKRAPTVTSLEEDGWVAISVMVEKKTVADVMDK